MRHPRNDLVTHARRLLHAKKAKGLQGGAPPPPILAGIPSKVKIKSIETSRFHPQVRANLLEAIGAEQDRVRQRLT